MVSSASDHPSQLSDVTAGDELRAENNALRVALTDMLGGWKYIRQHHGDMYGVGWDRCEQAAEAALAKAVTNSSGERRKQEEDVAFWRAHAIEWAQKHAALVSWIENCETGEVAGSTPAT